MGTLPRRRVLEIAGLAALGACTRGATSQTSIGSAASLPSIAPDLGVTLDDALRERRSTRSFTDRPVSRATIAHLLWASQGRTASWGGRTAPSAGALYPIELYVATADGVARYIAAQDATAQVVAEDRRLALAAATGGQPAATAALVLFVLSGVIGRTATKYGDRAERYVLLEAGHACQNLLLEATALGLGAVPIGAIDDDLVRAALGLDHDEQPLYVIPVGYPATE